eukprot:TRINITY_DN210_c1_g1_i12.p3 TRINITY_DN210_c1_g1~~TRINITY_DN210_c1_g1_i12.p3  ORF type:complete len:102 (+),score=21.88 TRINITY_DN210_c1_g1_i12:338-643(+)
MLILIWVLCDNAMFLSVETSVFPFRVLEERKKRKWKSGNVEPEKKKFPIRLIHCTHLSLNTGNSMQGDCTKKTAPNLMWTEKLISKSLDQATNMCLTVLPG